MKVSAPLHNPTRRSQGERGRGTLVAIQYALYAQSNEKVITYLSIFSITYKYGGAHPALFPIAATNPGVIASSIVS